MADEKTFTLADMPRLIRTARTGDKIFLVKDGKSHWVKNPQTLVALGYGLGAEAMVSSDTKALLETGDPIDMNNVGEFAETPAVSPAGEASSRVDSPPFVQDFGYQAVASPAELTEGKPDGEKPVEDKTSIIIPICNTDYPTAHYTGNCIGSIREHTRLPYEIIVVDNGSTCELGGWVWDKVPVKYIRNETNLGYPKAINQGILASTGKWVALLNSDVMVFDNWLEDLQASLEHAAVVTATPMYDCPWGRAVESQERRQQWINEPDTHKYLSDFQDFSCALTTRKILDEVGMLDENYGLGYGEDVDFKFRLQEKGYQVKSNKRVNTYHIGGATRHYIEQTVNFGELMDKNKAYTKEKWGLDDLNIPKFMREKVKPNV